MCKNPKSTGVCISDANFRDLKKNAPEQRLEETRTFPSIVASGYAETNPQIGTHID